MRPLTITVRASWCLVMDNDNNKPTPYQQKTGRMAEGTMSVDYLSVRNALTSLKAVQAYDLYLKEHKRRLRQLEKLAAGELSPGEDWYL